MKNQFKLLHTILFTSIIFLFAEQKIYCQNKKQKLISGGIITLQNDTMKGSILKQSDVDMQFRITFYDKNNTQTTYRSKNIKGYYLLENNDTTCFESFKYWKSFQFLNRNFFLKKMLDGKISLFLYREEGFNFTALDKTDYYYYFLRRDGKWINSKPITAYNFKRQLRNQLKDCEPILKDLENSKIFIDELPVLIQKYNRFCNY